MHSVECLSDTRDKLGESPLWVEEECSIYWVDIKRFLIHKFDTKNNNKHTKSVRVFMFAFIGARWFMVGQTCYVNQKCHLVRP